MSKTAPALLLSILTCVSPITMVEAVPGTLIATTESDAASTKELAIGMFEECGLSGVMEQAAFLSAYTSVERHGQQAGILAIADMTRPSTEKRLFIIDLPSRRLLLNTYVAHGQKTGELMAERFSNRNGSHQTSLGLYRVGTEIVSPKHGAALLLHGLDANLNSLALEREIIMHGADYVSEAFIAAHGRLGRSWGCPAISRTDMPRMIELLADGGLLYIHG